ncbi:transcriptional regulator, XRE family protein (plasmid) [Streptomyces microflavus]|uniref:transcriptional regulator, XRE family protein n=1 Tax=Streptomyces microflavus TaxID=1919 RepID=UPI002E14DBB2|nr:transcriptional regulator, XRE family protein [Streptomyces microflavus]
MPHPSLFHVLLVERRWDQWSVFCLQFERAARHLARELSRPKLASVTVSRKSFHRWAKGDWYGRPWPDTALILEHLFNAPAAQLFSPAPERAAEGTSASEGRASRTSVLVADQWPTSRFFIGPGEAIGSWELAGRQALDGTTAAVAFRTVAAGAGSVARFDAEDPVALDEFLRPARRGFLLGMDDRDSPRLFVVDAATARRARATSSGEAASALPRAQLLDDLTYGLLWSLVQLDDGLLADDSALEQEQKLLNTYLDLPRSAPSRRTVPDLTKAGAQWLGSTYCARHILRRLDGLTGSPAFWTREQTGEQAASWLWLRHKGDYLKALAARYPDATPLSRAFCIPEAVVRQSGMYERVLLLLSIALMELHGVRVDVLPKPEYSQVDGFALVPGQRAVVANWARTDGAIWAVDTVTSRPSLREYSEALGEARALSVMPGPDPEARLRAVAGYMDIDWAWLVKRSREMSAYGTASLVRPRSRHLTTESLDEVFAFLASFGPDR